MRDEMNLNLGCVIYSESVEGIDAKWVFNQNGIFQRGSGKGIRLTEINKENIFEGEYHITYMNENGDESPKLLLVISAESGVYHLIWKLHDHITDIGIGFVDGNQLTASYKKAEEE